MRWNTLLAVLGALLLLLSAALAVLLARPLERPVQATIGFQEAAVQSAPVELAVARAQPTVAEFPVAAGNLSRIELTLAVRDAQPASEPDRFLVELLDPDGRVALNLTLATPTPRAVGTPPAYVADERTVPLSVAVHDKPAPAYVDLHPGETARDALRRLDANATAPGAGTWRLRVTLVGAGGCPDPADDPPRSAACRAAQPDGADAGETVRVVLWRTHHWFARPA